MSEQETELDLDELERLRNSFSFPEEWGAEDFENCDGVSIGVDVGAYGTFFAEAEDQETADLVVAAVNSLKPLIARVRELEEAHIGWRPIDKPEGACVHTQTTEPDNDCGRCPCCAEPAEFGACLYWATRRERDQLRARVAELEKLGEVAVLCGDNFQRERDQLRDQLAAKTAQVKAWREAAEASGPEAINGHLYEHFKMWTDSADALFAKARALDAEASETDDDK